jgi:hypothetical protein
MNDLGGKRIRCGDDAHYAPMQFYQVRDEDIT